jgi:hypothetical protein
MSLLVHRIPESCTQEHIHKMFVNNCNIVPSKVLQITKISNGEGHASPAGSTSGALGKTTVLFSSKEHAILAFESISGPNRPDKNNRAQKRVYLKGGGYICIRKC